MKFNDWLSETFRSEYTVSVKNEVYLNHMWWETHFQKRQVVTWKGSSVTDLWLDEFSFGLGSITPSPDHSAISPFSAEI